MLCGMQTSSRNTQTTFELPYFKFEIVSSVIAWSWCSKSELTWCSKSESIRHRKWHQRALSRYLLLLDLILATIQMMWWGVWGDEIVSEWKAICLEQFDDQDAGAMRDDRASTSASNHDRDRNWHQHLGKRHQATTSHFLLSYELRRQCFRLHKDLLWRALGKYSLFPCHFLFVCCNS